jgi:hypothetical protein
VFYWLFIHYGSDDLIVARKMEHTEIKKKTARGLVPDY